MCPVTHRHWGSRYARHDATIYRLAIGAPFIDPPRQVARACGISVVVNLLFLPVSLAGLAVTPGTASIQEKTCGPVLDLSRVGRLGRNRDYAFAQISVLSRLQSLLNGPRAPGKRLDIMY